MKTPVVTAGDYGLVEVEYAGDNIKLWNIVIGTVQISGKKTKTWLEHMKKIGYYSNTIMEKLLTNIYNNTTEHEQLEESYYCGKPQKCISIGIYYKKLDKKYIPLVNYSEGADEQIIGIISYGDNYNWEPEWYSIHENLNDAKYKCYLFNNKKLNPDLVTPELVRVI